jgi:hypothetical protein
LSNQNAEPTNRVHAAASLDAMGNGNWGDEDELDIDADTMLHHEGQGEET